MVLPNYLPHLPREDSASIFDVLTLNNASLAAFHAADLGVSWNLDGGLRYIYMYIYMLGAMNSTTTLGAVEKENEGRFS